MRWDQLRLHKAQSSESTVFADYAEEVINDDRDCLAGD